MKPDYFAIRPDAPYVDAPEFPGLRLLHIRSQSGRRRLVANPDAHRYNPDRAKLFALVNEQLMTNQPPSWQYCGDGREMTSLWGNRQVRHLSRSKHLEQV